MKQKDFDEIAEVVANAMNNCGYTTVKRRRDKNGQYLRLELKDYRGYQFEVKISNV